MSGFKTVQTIHEQENLANANIHVRTRQQCVYEGP